MTGGSRYVVVDEPNMVPVWNRLEGVVTVSAYDRARQQIERRVDAVVVADPSQIPRGHVLELFRLARRKFAGCYLVVLQEGKGSGTHWPSEVDLICPRYEDLLTALGTLAACLEQKRQRALEGFQGIFRQILEYPAEVRFDEYRAHLRLIDGSWFFDDPEEAMQYKRELVAWLIVAALVAENRQRFEQFRDLFYQFGGTASAIRYLASANGCDHLIGEDWGIHLDD